MTLIFASKSYVGPRATQSSPPRNDEEEEEEEEEGEEEEEEEENDEFFVKPISSPSLDSSPSSSEEIRGRVQQHRRQHQHQHQQFSIVTVLVSALRKSLVTCSVSREDICAMEIGWPTDVRHIAHVTFDRFHGFLGLPVEFEPDVQGRVPSASVSVFGVSAKSMQCSYDRRGNSVPTILLLMQRRLYSQGGLLAEGIFRINAENSQEEYVRNQLNKGVIPRGIDLHCLAGLIKAWFRELPTGVLDALTPDQVMHCNTEEECAQLVRILPPTEAALLDWAINLMVDVVQCEQHNKMNARNIAMVFAPNMTQMADPLTALIHAVQVMNFLKTLILKTLREREESSPGTKVLSSWSESPNDKGESNPSNMVKQTGGGPEEEATNVCLPDKTALSKFLDNTIEDRMASDAEESFRSFKTKSEADEERELISEGSPPGKCKTGTVENRCRGGYNGGGEIESFSYRLSLRKGVRRLCRHPVFQLSKLVKKSGSFGVVNSRA